MLSLRRARNLTPYLRRQKFSDDEDDILFSNDKIESSHRPKNMSPFAVAFRTLLRIFGYTGLTLFGYTYYNYRQVEDYKSQPLMYTPVINTVRYVDDSILSVYHLFTEPPVDKLLPDMPKMPPGYMQPKTLVLDLKGTIVHIDYVFGKGYVIMKRPGLNEFLNKMSQMFEVVIFSDEEFHLTQQLSESLDPKHKIFSGRLGRESLCYRNGQFIKDLSFLNRDLKNVIMIEKNTDMVKNQTENLILLPEFTGDTEDKELMELVPFLEHLVRDRVTDVRQEIDKYGHVQTGKKYRAKLQSVKDQIMARQSRGLSGFMTSNRYRATSNEPGPLVDGELPKPPTS